MVVDFADAYASAMPKPPKKRKPAPQWRPINLRPWRKFRKLSTEALAAKAGMSAANISLLENGKQGYSQEGLEKLAKALDCRPGDLLDTDPRDIEVIKALRSADEDAREDIIRHAQIVIERRSRS